MVISYAFHMFCPRYNGPLTPTTLSATKPLESMVELKLKSFSESKDYIQKEKYDFFFFFLFFFFFFFENYETHLF